MLDKTSNLSRRAMEGLDTPNPMHDALQGAWDYLFDPVNPAINLGVAQNDLMHDELSQKIPASLGFEISDLQYGRAEGSEKLRSAVASTITRHFKPTQAVEPEHVVVTTGAGAAIFFLTMAVTDPGDSVLVVSPYYGNFDSDVCLDSQVDIVPLPLHPADSEVDDWDMDVDADVLHQTIAEAKANGKRIKALLLTNPHNPFGRCFSREGLETLLRFASKHRLHVISDEMYGLSTFGGDGDFISLLSLPGLDRLIDPSFVHIVYGLSKDFCMNGLRVGFIIDQHNPTLRTLLARSALFSYTSSIIDRLVSNILTDEAWVDRFLETNRRRLAEAYKVAVDALERNGLDFIPSHAGHFVVVDARRVLERKHRESLTVEDERRLWKALLDRGVYIAPGHVFHTRTPGLFRITFTINKHQLRSGIATLANVLSSLE